MQFKKAEKSQSKLRLAIFGPSGSGKTYSSLAIASGMGGKVALVDTERGSASKYADRFNFDVLELPKKDIETYVQAISMAAKAGYEILIIDSLSHAWKDLLAEVDKIARTEFKGNTWGAWSKGTPKQTSLVDALLSFPGHIIGTMRTKTEWTTEQTGKGKTRPVRVGLAPEQGKGIEYEFDVLIEINDAHFATVIKDRTGKYQDKGIEKPGAELGKELAAWLDEGIEYTPPHWSEDTKSQRQLECMLVEAGLSMEDFFSANDVDDWQGMTKVEGTGKDAFRRAKEYWLDEPGAFCQKVLVACEYYKSPEEVDAAIRFLGIGQDYLNNNPNDVILSLKRHAEGVQAEEAKSEPGTVA